MSAAAALGVVALTLAAAPAGAAGQPRDLSVVGRYADALGAANGRLPIAVRRDLAERLLLLSSYYKLDPCLLAALVSVESAWRARAVSPAGALGYGQLMPGTAAGLDVNALEPYENLDGTARYLRRMLNRYQTRDVHTRMRLALASYNAGPAAVARYNGVPHYRETRAYVDNVLRMRATFVASVTTRATYDVAALLADRPGWSVRSAALRQPVEAQSRAAYLARGVHANVTLAARRKVRPYHVVAFDAPRPVRVAPAPSPTARYETSHSFFARLLGIRHRTTSAATIASKDVPRPADDAVVLPVSP